MAAMEILGVDNVLFAVGDVLLARRFYSDVLGLAESFAFPEAGIVGYKLGNETPGLLIRLDPDLSPRPPLASPRLWLEVPDTHAAEALLHERGTDPIEPARQTRTGWVVEVADPWGNVIGLTDYSLAPAMARDPASSED
ncbi:VOC family protein [Acidothermaceae bacterium B102]|nr:VOC family protein [Acidothermaceae bacterium B102]